MKLFFEHFIKNFSNFLKEFAIYFKVFESCFRFPSLSFFETFSRLEMSSEAFSRLEMGLLYCFWRQ